MHACFLYFPNNSSLKLAVQALNLFCPLIDLFVKILQRSSINMYSFNNKKLFNEAWSLFILPGSAYYSK